MAHFLLLVLLAGCPGPNVVPGEQGPQLRVFLEGTPGSRGGVLVVQSEYDVGTKFEYALPHVQGLTFVGDEAVPERIGGREVVTAKYRFSGDEGSYVIEPLAGKWSEGDRSKEVLSNRVFVDIGSVPPREGLVDIDEPRRVWSNLVPWRLLAGVALVVGLLGGGIVVAFWNLIGRKPPPLPPDPPDLLIIRLWEAIRSDSNLDAYEKALRLSRIFREYAEEVLHFPAVSFTTSQTVTHLRGLQYLPEGNVDRAKRLLQATDLVKFADQVPGSGFFDDLDDDLRTFVGTTRPHRWGES
ncbi:MAG: hypothetical protein HN348_17765 [Proteobacteria bacterium]|nr:hypothetical protein [Pseudomonadota bacterium]